MKYYDKLIFELSQPGRCGYSLPENRWEETCEGLPAALRRGGEARLPEVSEPDVVRHYTNLSNMNFGVDTGFYPLGSCTMKYNPKINEEIASMPGFACLHPLQPEQTAQGALQLYHDLGKALSAITGMAEFTLNPFAGAHGELTGLMIMRQYHLQRGDLKRTRVIVPDSAHGTNPASAAVCGLEVVVVKSKADGTIDTDELAALLDDTIAFSTPHGGGGPGSGPVGVAARLAELLPYPRVTFDGSRYHVVGDNSKSAGRVSGFAGNFTVLLKAYAYILSLGKQNIKLAGALATLNANYIKESLKDCYKLPIDTLCKHEFVFDGLADKSTGITTLDVAKRLLDYGFHAPTVYFPLLFHQSIMIEPTETESKETLDAFIAVMRKIAEEAASEPDTLREAPHSTPVRRLDETTAAKNPVLTYFEM